VSEMVQVSERVGTAQKGSMKAVSGSGMASISEASMLFQPRMLEPSKPRPSVKISSVNSRMGQGKCCQVPKVSTNLMSIILAPFFLAFSITLLGVLIYGCMLTRSPDYRATRRTTGQPCRGAQKACRAPLSDKAPARRFDYDLLVKTTFQQAP